MLTTVTVVDVTYPSKNPSLCRVRLDDGTILNLSPASVAGEGLQVGASLKEERVELLRDLESLEKAKGAALRYLGYRPRSEGEVRTKLKRLGIETNITERTMDYLKERDLVNDHTFVRFWKENRLAFRPRSSFLIKQELMRKGVPPQVIDEEVGDVDEQEAAYQAALKKLRTLDCQDYHTFREKLGSFLRRRGFSYSVITLTVDRLWEQRGNPS